MRFAYVATNLLDLWMEPRFNSERASQLLFCELLTIHDEQQGYFSVKRTDGYSGWVDKRQVVEIDEQSFRSSLASPKVVVKSSQAMLYEPRGHATAPHILLYGTLVRAGRGSSELARITLPDGQSRFLKASALVRPQGMKQKKLTGAMLASEAKRFLGVPYLWGGVSPLGFDCSGLTQTISRRFGLHIPRDTKDQITIGRAIDREEAATGDLLFFKRHVGFAIGKDKIIHSSVSGSGVRVNSLRPGMPDYRKDLDRDFDQARRIV